MSGDGGLPPVEHDPVGREFSIPLERGRALMTYDEPDERTLDLDHTFVPRPYRGTGIGGALARHALEHARAEGKRVIPSCPFVRAWIESHPEHRDLLA